MPTKVFPGRLESLQAIGQFVTQEANLAGLNHSQVYEIELSVDEACTNIIEHGYAGRGEQNIKCTCTHSKDKFRVVLRDSATKFDPRDVPPPQFGKKIEDVGMRGVGLYLIQQLVDEIKYQYIPGEGNVLTLIKRIQS